MKKPKIWNDITNIFAKWAGSPDYDPRVKYDTSLEFYANQVPVLPKPKAGDNGKSVVVKSDGTYELAVKAATPAEIVAATAQMTEQQTADTRQNIGAEPEKFVITVTYDAGNDEYTADKTYAEIVAAYEAGKTCVCYREDQFIPLVYNDYDTILFESLESGTDVMLRLEPDPDAWTLYEWGLSIVPFIITDSASTSITLAASANTEYHYGTLTALTISSFSPIGKFWIWFTSGATPTITTGIANFAAEANKVYKITVENGYATYDSWATS